MYANEVLIYGVWSDDWWRRLSKDHRLLERIGLKKRAYGSWEVWCCHFVFELDILYKILGNQYVNSSIGDLMLVYHLEFWSREYWVPVTQYIILHITILYIAI